MQLFSKNFLLELSGVAGIRLRKRIFVSGVIAAFVVMLACARLHDQFRDSNGQANSEPQTDQTRAAPQIPELAYGNPSNATSEPKDENNLLLVGESSVISYNNSRGTINWVFWKTARSDLGNRLERPDFRPDPRLPNWYMHIGYYDYSGSGYDRGHMVPSADRFANPRLNEETFMMTNIVPQTGALNQYSWNSFEMYARSQARTFDVYQIAGVYGDQGRLKGKITVPTNCWKIIAIVPKGRSADSIDARTRIVAVDMPNIEGIENESWEKYRTSIRAIEEKTGLDFFAAMPRQLQDTIETRIETRSR